MAPFMFVFVIVMIITAAWLFSDYIAPGIIRKYVGVVIGKSMEPTIKCDGGYAFYIGMPAHRTQIHRGDIVSARFRNLYGDGKDVGAVKRVIGLPGDYIELGGKHVWVNGKILDEPYIKKPAQSYECLVRQLGADEYFLMGDNRDASCDSRHLGPIRERDLKQKVLKDITYLFSTENPRPIFARVGNQLRKDAQQLEMREREGGRR